MDSWHDISELYWFDDTAAFIEGAQLQALCARVSSLQVVRDAELACAKMWTQMADMSEAKIKHLVANF